MKTAEPDTFRAERSTDLVMIVPLGLDESIFPWGPKIVTEFAQSRCPNRRCSLWDVRSEASLTRLAATHRELLEQLFLAIPAAHRPLFMGHSPTPYLMYELVAYLGGDVWDGLDAPPGAIQRAEDFKAAHDQALAELLGAYRTPHARVFAISVYDYTVFGALGLARAIKRLVPACHIVFGGDYVTQEIGVCLTRDCVEVDAAVVGYGEEPLADLLSYLDNTGSLAGFDNAAAIVSAQALPQTAFTLRAPPHYGKQDRAAPVVHSALSDGVIHVLTQRGCSWGECTFCSQLDRRSYYPVRLDEILDDMPGLVARASTEDGTMRVSFDSDENDITRVLPIAERVAAHIPHGARAELLFWLMVRSFRTSLCDAGLRLAGVVRFNVRLNIESLSLDRLRLMKKGFSPLQALEAVKALLDTGQRVSTNYFTYYPGEVDPGSTLEETRLLRAGAHLLLDPELDLSSFPYAMNGRDTIAENPERFGMRCLRLAGDNWVRRAFGADLPFSIWAYELSPGESCPEQVQAEMRWITARKLLAASRVGLAVLRGGRLGANDIRSALAAEIAEVNCAGAEMERECAKANGASTAERVALLNALARAKSDVSLAIPELRYRKIRLRDDAVETMPADPSEASTTMLLSPEQRAILRYLYWIRKERELRERFLNADAMLAELSIMGLVIEQRGHWLSLVRDPEYWTLPAGERDIPDRLSAPEHRAELDGRLGARGSGTVQEGPGVTLAGGASVAAAAEFSSDGPRA